MRTNTVKKLLCLVLSLCMLLSLFAGCKKNNEPQTTASEPNNERMTYTVQVLNQGGLFLQNVGVYVYEDATLAELVWFANTDANGKITFTDLVRDGYVAVLADVPTGYEAESMYPITGEITQIVLSAGQMSTDPEEQVTYKLGDMVMDFTVEDPSKDTYTLSKLLEQKKAVVLNFWYTTCAPCKAEFPYLQEAYEQYSEDIAILAMDPLNSQEEVQKFKEEMNLTFPMMACDPQWEKIMGLTAYPTTVVIDRYGNIVLIHKGSIDNAKTFTDAFAWFVSDTYEQKLITDITSLKQEEEEGSESNPIELGGVMDFEVTVEPGKVVYTDLYKVKNMYMQIASEDAYVIYNGNTYEAKNGVVGLVVNAPDTYTPARIGIGNKGSQKQTFKAYLSILQGTLNNPYPIALGEFDAKVSAGNDQGVYYSYTAKEDGVFSLKCLQATAGVKYGFTLYNLNSYAQRTLDSEGETGADGYPVLSIEAKKGHTVQVIISTLPDDSNTYPAASFKMLAEFSAGEIKEEVVVKQIPYTVTVVDDAGAPVPNVSITLTAEVAEGEEQPKPVTIATDAQGVAQTLLPEGNYKGSFTVPEGFDPVENTEFTLSVEKPDYTVTLKKTVIILYDYTVTVTDSANAPVAGVKLKLGDSVVTTDAKGSVSFRLEDGSYSVYLQELPADYMAQQETYTFPAGQRQLKIQLTLKPGSAGNPYKVSTYPCDTATLKPGTELHYALSGAENMVLNIRNSTAYAVYGGKTYVAVDGLVSVPLGNEKEATVIIGNAGEEEAGYVLRLSHPAGSEENPIALTELGDIPVALKQGVVSGCFYTWVAAEKGTVIFSIKTPAEGVTADIWVTVGDTCVKLSEAGGATELAVPVDVADEVSVQVMALPGAGEAPAAQLVMNGRFELLPNSAENPEVLTDISKISASLDAGDADGRFFSWTAPEKGSLALGFAKADMAGDIWVTAGNAVYKYSESANGFSVQVDAGAVVSVQILAKADNAGKLPAAQLEVNGSFTKRTNSANEPQVLANLGAAELALENGNKDGWFYSWTAARKGTVRFGFSQIPEGRKADATLTLNGTTYALTEFEGVRDILAQVKAGDTVQLWVGMLPDADGRYCAAKVQLSGSFTPRTNSAEAPEELEQIESITAMLERGDADGWFYTWTAAEEGSVHFAVSSITAGVKAEVCLTVNGTSYKLSEAGEAGEVSAPVQPGDVVAIHVTALADSNGSIPDAKVTLRGEFRLPPNSAEHPQILTDISRTEVTLEEGDADGWFCLWTPINSGTATFKFEQLPAAAADIIVSTGDTVVKLSDGMTDAQGAAVVTLQVRRKSAVMLQITGNAEPMQAVVLGEFVKDPNSAENPDVLTDISSIVAQLEEEDADGRFYVWTAAEDGSVHFRIDQLTEGVQADIRITVAGVTYALSDVPGAAEVTAKVMAGDEVDIQLVALSGEGEIVPAANLTVSGEFKLPPNSAQYPEILESIESIATTLEAGDADGWFYRWTAPAKGSVRLTLMQITEGVQADIQITVNGVTRSMSDVAGAKDALAHVQKGDTVAIRVAALPAGDGNTPAAELTVKGVFTERTNSEQNPDEVTDISRIEASLERYDANGFYYSWLATKKGSVRLSIASISAGTKADIWVSVGNEVYKLSENAGASEVLVQVKAGDLVSIRLFALPGANGIIPDAALTVAGVFKERTNGAENPDSLTDISNITTDLEPGLTEGHYYSWTAQYDGTVSFTLSSITQNVKGNISLRINGGQAIAMTGSKVEAAVKAGDQVLIQVAAAADTATGRAPAAKIVLNGAFTHKLGSGLNPQVITDISQFTASPESGSADGYYLSWSVAENTKAEFYIAQAQINGAAVSGDPAEQIDLELYVNGTLAVRLSDNETKDSEGNRIVSLSVKKNDQVSIRVVTLGATHPAANVTVKSRIVVNYSVTVADMLGKVFAGVAVTVRDASSKVVYSGTTNASGNISFTAAGANYTVELAFEGTAYYYNKATAVLSATRPSLNINLADYLDDSDIYKGLSPLNGAKTYSLPLGGTYVEIGTNKAYYAADQGENCLFVFHPTEGGTYKFTVDNPAVEIAYYGLEFFPHEANTSRGTADNAFTESVLDSTAGNIDMIIAVKPVAGVEGVVVTITRIGPPDFSWEDVPVSDAWQSGHTHGTACQNAVTGVTYLDINALSGKYELYYNEATGFYHLEKDGPVIYVDLNSTRFGISLYKIIHGDGTAGGAPIRRYFYDENGMPTRLEDYTAILDEYFQCSGLVTSDTEHSANKIGFHPLTKDLVYILQNGGKQWFDPASPNMITQLTAANPEYAWMFLCGYVE